MDSARPVPGVGGPPVEPTEYPRTHRRRRPPVRRILALDSRAQPRRALWQLDSIAVDPTVQGRGFGGALISSGLDRARADGVGAFLSTGMRRNVSIYARYGFRVVEAIDAPGDGPRIRFMRWDP